MDAILLCEHITVYLFLIHILMGIWVVSLVELLHIVCGCEHSCESLVNMYVQF